MYTFPVDPKTENSSSKAPFSRPDRSMRNIRWVITRSYLTIIVCGGRSLYRLRRRSGDGCSPSAFVFLRLGAGAEFCGGRGLCCCCCCGGVLCDGSTYV